MIKKLEKIRELTSTFENRIKSVESDNVLKKIGYDFLGMVESTVRGAIVGGTIGALVSGFDKKYIMIGTIIK